MQKTIDLTKNLTKSQVQGFAKQGVTKEWVQKNLSSYIGAFEKAGAKLKNTQLAHRKELMEKIISLWE